MSVMGVIMTPAIEPEAAARANDHSTIRLSSIPTKRADILSKEQALMAFPVRVNLKKKCSPMATLMPMAMIQMDWGRMAASKTMMGSLPENAGRSKESFPHTNMAPPRKHMDTPMVRIINVTMDLPC